jgi:hypothetical protein
MKSFYTIIQKHCNPNPKNIYYPDENNGNGNGCLEYWLNIYKSEFNMSSNNVFIKSVFYNFINMMFTKLKNPYYLNRFPKVKMIILNETLSNIFLSESQKEEILVTFSKIQRTYYAFSKLAFIFKIKKARLQITTDLGMNDIDVTKRNVIPIYQNKANYLFIIQDLVNIIETSLSNSCNYFSEPLPIKNPYNNLQFSIATLYYIYFYIKERNYLMPQLFHLYFLENFNLKNFSNNNECYIRDIAIKKYIYTTPATYLYNKILIMMATNSYTASIKISEGFPMDKLVNIMRPYLYYNQLGEFSLNTDKRHYYKYLFQKKMKDFYLFNKHFGRKIVKIVKGKPSIIEFNDKHVTFNSFNENDVCDWSLMCKEVVPTNNLFENNDEYNDDDDDDDL